ncbi:ribosome biogenesis GTPase Der [Candidatus Dependentiae bacterium HGW-Dependentiae-1]|nr:MAG: ribosome biogenesis GTPase Der [Candidatus Dependentiae bacterium HGW-Dependentiae-1]
MKSNYPSVVIVGRTNVGKSTLFNRLSEDVKSLTLDFHGVTRDFLKDTISWQGRFFDLIDTGGVSLQKTEDELAEKTRLVALNMLEKADLVLFVCDGTTGVLSEDLAIAKMLHKLGKKALLVVNKSDTHLAQERQYEFARLGHQPVIVISAQHGLGIADLLEAIVHALPEKTVEQEEKEVRCRVVLLGKPNVGKSSLMNLLLKQERSIVTNQPGTTREPISERITFYKEDMLITDTPGIRKKHSVTEKLETMMVGRALRSIEDSGIVLLLIDAHEGRISDQELKLAFYTFEKKYKALIVLRNKQDLVDEDLQDSLDFSLSEYQFFMKKIEQLSISCVTEKNIGKILPLVDQVWHRYTQQLPDERELTLLFQQALAERPLFHQSMKLEVFKARQVVSGPITIVMRVNNPQWFGSSQLAFFEGVLRAKFDLKGVPIKFVARRGKIV